MCAIEFNKDHPMRLLMIEDNPSDAILLQVTLDELGDYYEITQVQRLADGLSVLSERQFDLLFLDLSLPDSLGISTLTKVLAIVPNLPVIILSGLDDEDLAIKAVQTGADGYLVKWRFGASLLKRTILIAISHKQKIAQLEKQLQEISGYESLLKTVIDNIHEGLLVIGADRTVNLCNSVAAITLGYTAETIIGQTIEIKDIQNTAMRIMPCHWQDEEASLVILG